MAHHGGNRYRELNEDEPSTRFPQSAPTLKQREWRLALTTAGTLSLLECVGCGALALLKKTEPGFPYDFQHSLWDFIIVIAARAVIVVLLASLAWSRGSSAPTSGDPVAIVATAVSFGFAIAKVILLKWHELSGPVPIGAAVALCGAAFCLGPIEVAALASARSAARAEKAAADLLRSIQADYPEDDKALTDDLLSAEGGGSGGGAGGLFDGYRTEEEMLRAEIELLEKPAKAMTALGILSLLRPYFWPGGDTLGQRLQRRTLVCLTWVAVAISKASSVCAPLLLQHGVTALETARDDGTSVAPAVKFVIGYAAATYAARFFKECQSLLYIPVQQRAFVEIAEYTYSHVQSLSMQWHLKKKMGNVIRSMDRGADAANSLVNWLFLYLLPALAECVSVCVVFASVYGNVTMGAVAFGSLALYVIVTVKITVWRKKFRNATNKHDNDYHDSATDSLTNFETVKMFTNEDFETRNFKSIVAKFQKFTAMTTFSLSVINCSQYAISNGALGANLAIAAGAYMKRDLTMGQFVACSAYMVQLFAPLSYLGTVYSSIVNGLIDLQSLSQLWNEAPDVNDLPGAPALLRPPPGQGLSIAFEHVHFRYPGQPICRSLRDVSFAVEAGTATGVVGPTGAGKTSISRLLFRFYDTKRGRVLMGGSDVRLLTQRSVRACAGIVPQDTVLFNSSIRHNVAYGDLSAPEGKVRAACASAQLEVFLSELPLGWDTVVGERGLKLSGGEKQRVSIARCLLKDPPLVLLDEATSALDTRTERQIQAALASLRAARTMLIVAHRLSTIMDCEQILVLEGGQVVEGGTHAELTAKAGGAYARMWAMQLSTGSSGDLAALDTEQAGKNSSGTEVPP